MDIYSISLDLEDYLELLSRKYNKKYVACLEIPTTMTFTDIATEGRGRSFDWWPQLYQVIYDAFISSDIDYDFNRVYTRGEVEKLVADKTIVLSIASHRAIDENNISFTKEEYKPLLIECNFDINGNTLAGFIKDNYSLYVKYLRKRITKQKILRDIKNYTVDLRKDIEAITNLSNKDNDPYSEISRLCKKWYESSGDKKEFMLLQKKQN